MTSLGKTWKWNPITHMYLRNPGVIKLKKIPYSEEDVEVLPLCFCPRCPSSVIGRIKGQILTRLDTLTEMHLGIDLEKAEA